MIDASAMRHERTIPIRNDNYAVTGTSSDVLLVVIGIVAVSTVHDIKAAIRTMIQKDLTVLVVRIQHGVQDDLRLLLLSLLGLQ